MPFRAFYIDSGVEVSEQDLLALGVERFQVNADLIDKEGTEPTLEKICVERNYNYKDVVSIIIVTASLVNFGKFWICLKILKFANKTLLRWQWLTILIGPHYSWDLA